MKMIDLLKDPLYRKYFLKNPRFPYKLANDKPWIIWIHRTSKNTNRLVWANVRVATFKDAVAYVKPRMREWEDFSITSLVIGFDPPKNVRNAFELSDWCVRCRRPVEMRPFARHHALDRDIHEYFAEWPVCPFCGASADHQYTLVPG